MSLAVMPQLLGNRGLDALRDAARDPDRWAIEPKVDGVRSLVVYESGQRLETRNRYGVRRDWLRGDGFEGGLRRLTDRLPLLWHGTVLDGELTAGQFRGTMAALPWVEAIPRRTPVRRLRRSRPRGRRSSRAAVAGAARAAGAGRQGVRRSP